MSFSRKKRSATDQLKREAHAAARRRRRQIRFGHVGGLERFEIELLERRVLLAVTASLSGSAATFTGTGDNDLWLKDSSGDLAYSTDGTDYLTQFSLSPSGTQSILVSAVSTITVNSGGDGSTLYLDDTITSDLLTDWATLTETATSTDIVSLAGGSNDHTWTIQGSNDVQLDSNIFIHGAGFLVGSGGSNVFDFTTGASGDTININGGSGSTDALDFSAFPTSTPVTVNLRTGTATGTSGISNIHVVNGGAGNDTLTAGVGDETLNGGSGSDTLVFDPDSKEGSDTVIESPGTSSGAGTLDFSQAQSAVTVDISSTAAQTIDSYSNLTLTLASDDTIENVLGGAGNNTITCNSLDDTVTAGSGTETFNAGPGDDTFNFGPNWRTGTVYDNGVQEGLYTLDFSGVTANLTANINPSNSTGDDANGALEVTDGSDSVNATDIANLIGGTGSNTLNYGDYYSSSGTGVTVDLATDTATTFQSVQKFENVSGSNYNDSITGDSSPNLIISGPGDNTLSGGGGDTIMGGSGVNTLVESFDANMTLTNTSLAVTPFGQSTTTTETLSGIEIADLTGGTDSNKIDASAFNAGHVVISGGTTTPLSLLKNGFSTTNGTFANLLGAESTTLVSTLNNDFGVAALGNGKPDFEIILTDGSSVNVTLSINSTTTVQDVLDQIADAAPSGRLIVQLDQELGNAITIQDTVDGSSDIQVVALNNSPAASDLGILTTGSGQFLEGTQITQDNAHIDVTLTDGTQLPISLSGAQTALDVINLIDAASPDLAARINSAGTGLDLIDTSGGTGNLTVTAANGSPAGTDLGLIGVGSGGVLHGTSIVAGHLFLDNRARNDTLIGSRGDDSITAGGGNATIMGGGGTDTLVESFDANFTLTNSSLAVALKNSTATFTESLSGIDQASLTGGASGDDINASAFTLGSITLIGGTGNDTLLGGSRNDFLTGGGGQDRLSGGGGYNTEVETQDTRFIASGTPSSATLDMGQGTNQVDTLSLIGTVTGGTFTISYGNDETDPIDFDASAPELQSALQSLASIGPDNVAVQQTVVNGPWAIVFLGVFGAGPLANLDTDSSGLTGGGSVSSLITTTGMNEVNTLTNIQAVDLTGGNNDMLMDASGYTGDATLYGGGGDNTILASSGKDYVSGGTGNNFLTAGTGLDTLIGGSGQNELIVNSTKDISYTLTNTTLTATGAGITGSQVDPISGFQMADISSGAASGSSGVKVDASEFSGLSTSTGLAYFNNDQGEGTITGSDVNMTGLLAQTALASLNNNTGVQTAPGGGNDFQITLTNGSMVDVSIAGAETVQDVANAIENASSDLTVSLNSAGDALVITDSSGGIGNLTVTALNNSPAAGDLGILGTGQGDTLTGWPISDGASDLRISLQNGTKVDVDLSNLYTIQDVLTAIEAASTYLAATLDSAGTAIVLTDSSAGSGTFSVADMNGSTAALDLGLDAAAAGGTLTGGPIAFGSVTLTGGSGDDTLVGGPGTDFLSGGSGNNVLFANGATATVVESGDWNFTLTDSMLTMAPDGGSTPAGSDQLTGITQADLTGGANTTLFDASQFSLGDVTMTTAGGLPTLMGGTGGTNEFNLDVNGLTAPSSATDTAHQFKINEVGIADDVNIFDGSSTVNQSDLWWVNDPGSAEKTYTIGASYSPLLFGTKSSIANTLNVKSNIIMPGTNIILQGEYVNISGATISTDAVGQAGSITFTSRHITITQGAVLSALGTGPAGSDGTITIDAEDPSAKITQVPGLGNVQVNLNNTSVTIDGATISGGEVYVQANSDSQHFLNVSDFSTEAASLGTLSSEAVSSGTPAADTAIKSILGVSFV